MWFDSHCHFDFAAFNEDRLQVLERAHAAGVTELFIPGVEPTQWAALPSFQNAFGFRFGIGHHPGFLAQQELTLLRTSLKELSATATALGASAIGETGLDQVVAKRGGASLQLQSECFEAHLRTAKELDLPLILHVVQAHGRALQLLKRYAPFPKGGVLHSYSGSAELVGPYQALGLMFSFSGAITQPSAKKSLAALSVVPEARLLLETDAPDQPPSGFKAPPAATEFGAPDGAVSRQKGSPRNEPCSLISVAARVAEFRGTTRKHVLNIASANARRLFGVK